MKVEKGQITDIVTPKLDVRTPFGVRAPVAVWRKFLSPNPPPLFHDFFAISANTSRAWRKASTPAGTPA